MDSFISFLTPWLQFAVGCFRRRRLVWVPVLTSYRIDFFTNNPGLDAAKILRPGGNGKKELMFHDDFDVFLWYRKHRFCKCSITGQEGMNSGVWRPTVGKSLCPDG